MANMHCPSSKGEEFMPGSSKHILTRRQAMLLSATAGIGVVAVESALASDSIETAAHQEPGNVSAPRSAIAMTQYGNLRGFLDGGVLTFKGVPYGASTAGENRWLLAKQPAPWTDEYPALVYLANCPQNLHPWTGIEHTFLFDWDGGWQSEGMLKLNIWTPSQTGKRPVMFYMHGAGSVSDRCTSCHRTRAHGWGVITMWCRCR
jgi:para-nitrobenzyl esterase